MKTGHQLVNRASNYNAYSTFPIFKVTNPAQYEQFYSKCMILIIISTDRCFKAPRQHLQFVEFNTKIRPRSVNARQLIISVSWSFTALYLLYLISFECHHKCHRRKFQQRVTLQLTFKYLSNSHYIYNILLFHINRT